MAARFVEDVDGVLVPAPPDRTTTRSHDLYVVDAAPLAEALHGFVTGWSRTHPRDAAQQDRIKARRPEVTPVSAVEWLTTESGIPAATIENFLRRDQSTGRPAPRYSTTDLRIADALLTAIDRPDMLHDEALNIRRRKRVRGSLTGEA